MNLFSYSLANPIRWSDPLGLKVCKCNRRLDQTIFMSSSGFGPLVHTFVQIVDDQLPCGGVHGVAWGFQASSGGRVLPERGPVVNRQERCVQVDCVDEQKLLREILADIKRPPYPYRLISLPSGSCGLGDWNRHNCQGWADDVLRRSRIPGCCIVGPAGPLIPQWPFGRLAGP